jgi:predicted nucleic acid-binding protein
VSRVFWDTNIYIYFFEDYGIQGRTARDLRERMLKRGDQLITSTMTLGEILVKPLERQDLNLCKQYEEAITATSIVLPFDLKAAKKYSMLRLDRNLKAPDAIQLASAAAGSVDLFITNDSRLSDLRVEGIQFIVPLSRAPL